MQGIKNEIITIMKSKKRLSKSKELMFFFGLMLYVANMFSQSQQLPQRWNLQTCIDYALENNIQVKAAESNKRIAVVDTKLARAAMLPAVSASISQNLSNYPFTNNEDGTSSLTGSGSYSLNTSWQIFDGGVRSINIKQSDLSNEIAFLDIEESKDNIKLAIIQNYFQILYTNESIIAFENALQLSEAQLESNKIKLEVGAVTKSDVSQWESQYASDKYQLINAQISLDNYKLQLKQLLELDTLETMEIVIVEPSKEEVLALLPDQKTIFQTAVNIMPQVKSGALNTAYNELGVTKAKAGYLPKISLQAGIGTGNLYDKTDYNFTSQLKTNWYNSIGLSVNIPIYSNREVKSAVEKAKINIELAKLNQQSIYKDLYANVETTYLNVINSQSQYYAAEEKVRSSQESYDLMEEQFRLGMVNTIELLTEKNTLVSARQQLLQAKYTALINRKILDYYQGLI